MRHPFEVGSDFDPVAEMEEEGFIGDYEADEMAFAEEDFEALGIDPSQPTEAKPGSEEKVLMLSARYSAGLPLWHEEDCYDHGPEKADSNSDNQDEALDDLDDLEELG